MAQRSSDGNETAPRTGEGVGQAADPVTGEAMTARPDSGTPGVGGGAADALNPGAEDAYWRDNFRKRPYADETISYDYYRPAYRYGWESRARFRDRRWDEVERELERGWRENRGDSRLGWSDAKLAARDAWQRVDHRLADARDRDQPQESDAHV